MNIIRPFPLRARRAESQALLAKRHSTPYAHAMATKPTNSARLFALTSSGACSVTLTQDGKIHTWQALPDGGGQTTFIIPAGAVAELSDENAILSQLPFNVALGAGSSSIGGSIDSELQTSLALTADESNLVLSSLTWNGLCAMADTEWLKTALLNCVSGDTAVINLSSCWGGGIDGYKASTTPLLRGDNGIRFILGEGVPNLKRMVLKMSGFWDGNSEMRFYFNNSNVDYIFIGENVSGCSFPHMERNNRYSLAKSLTYIFPGAPNDKGAPIGALTTYGDRIHESNLPFPIRFILPCCIKGAKFSMRSKLDGEWVDDLLISHYNITAAMPSYVSSFSFYKTNLNSVENLVYLMDNLGTPSEENLPQLTFGVAAELVDTSGDEPVYRNADLQNAVGRLRAKGWEDVPAPIYES